MSEPEGEEGRDAGCWLKVVVMSAPSTGGYAPIHLPLGEKLLALMVAEGGRSPSFGNTATGKVPTP